MNSGPINTAAEEAVKAARYASAHFERVDKCLLYHASANFNTNWLLSETACTAVESPTATLKDVGPPDKNGCYTFLVPKTSNKQLHVQEMHQIVRELVERVYVFNQVPFIQFEANYDTTTTVFIPSAYHDTLVGQIMLSLDYHVKSLVHGTTIPKKDKRNKALEDWKTFPSNKLRQEYKELGLVEVASKPEIKEPFVRYPAKGIDSELAYQELPTRLTTGEEFEQQEKHLGRDMFMRYLDHVSINLIFKQRQIQQTHSTFILNPSFDITTGVLTTKRENNNNLYCHLHTYLQQQRDFVTKNLYNDPEIAHDVELLGFISFMVTFLLSLKKQNKVCSCPCELYVFTLGEYVRRNTCVQPFTYCIYSISISKVVNIELLACAKKKDLLRTDRELPPTLPSEKSRWSPYTAENNYSSLHGGIEFHQFQQTVEDPGLTPKEAVMLQKAIVTLESQQSECEPSLFTLREQNYYLLRLSIEPYYTKTPKLPRWIHAMVSELKSQCARQPIINDSRIQEMLRKSIGPRQASTMKTVNVLLQASIENGLLPNVCALLKRCTQTRLNKPDENGMTLIHYAASNGRSSVLSALLLSGSNCAQPVHSTKDQQPTATQSIHLATQSGSLDSVCCLLHYGADMSVKDNNGWAPIHYAAFHNYQSLVSHFFTVDRNCIETPTANKDKSTPLLLAARNGCFDTFKRLVELGADVSGCDSAGRNVVHIAASHHHINILQYLIDSTQVNVWENLSEMLKSEDNFAESAARSMDTLTQLHTSEHDQLIKHKAIDSLVQLLKKDERLQQFAVQVLSNVSNIDSIKSALQRAGAIPHLVKLLTSTRDHIQTCTCIILSDLGTIVDNQAPIAKAGAIPHLVKLLESPNRDVQLYSCACIGILAYDNPDNQTIVLQASGLPVLVSLLKTPHMMCIRGCAAHTLQCVIEGNRNNQLASLTADVIPPLVELLRSRVVSVHKNAARAIEALGENCEESQCELLSNIVCVNLLKRLLKMRDPTVKVSGGCALWAIAGGLISNQRLIATHMGLELLVDMLTVHNEKLDYVCSEALGSLASELGDNQTRIARVGGVKPLVEVLTLPTSQRVCLSVIHTLAALTTKTALVPNTDLQKSIATARGIVILASIVEAPRATEVVRVEAACTLAKLVICNPENDCLLSKHTDFSYLTIFKFFTSPDAMVRLLAGYCLTVMAFNNPTKLERMKLHGSLNISNFVPFLQSSNEFFQVHAAFQIIVLSELLFGIRSVDATVQGIRLLVHLLSSDVEQTKVLSAEFIATLAHSRGPGVPYTIVMAGGLEPLMLNLSSGNGPVIESSCVALGYLSFNSVASRLITASFRDNPEYFAVFKEHFDTVIVSQKFLDNWTHISQSGLPVLRCVIFTM